MELLINAIRVSLTVLIIGVLPGESLIYLLFGNSQLDLLERFYLTVLSSVAITSLIAFALSRTEGGLTALALIWAISLFVAFCLLAAWLRSQALAGNSPLAWREWAKQLREGKIRLSFRPSHALWLLADWLKRDLLRPFSREKLSKSLFSRPLAGLGNRLLLGTSLFVMLSAVIGLSTTNQSLALTEFYITAEGLSSEGVEYSFVKDWLVVPVGITNREGKQISYRIEGWLDGEQVTTQRFIAVNDGESWQGSLSLPLQSLKDAEFVDIKLFWLEESTPMGQLRLWLSPDTMIRKKSNEFSRIIFPDPLGHSHEFLAQF